MAMYYNTETHEFPRHDGDLILVDPTWVPGNVLPEPWVEVTFVEPEQLELPYVSVMGLPILKNGIWTFTWVQKELSNAEIEAALNYVAFVPLEERLP
jgi:hypothetical protein